MSAATTKRAWTARERQALRDHYGPLSPRPWPAARIARELGRTVAAVRSAARTFGLAWAYRGRADPDRFLALHRAGHGDVSIARVCEVCTDTVAAWRTRAGLPPGGRHGPASHLPRYADRIRELRSRGLGVRRIARELGIDKRNAARYVRQLESAG